MALAGVSHEHARRQCKACKNNVQGSSCHVAMMPGRDESAAGLARGVPSNADGGAGRNSQGQNKTHIKRNKLEPLVV